MKRAIKIASAAALFSTANVAVAADPWVVRRARSSGQCWVLKATASGNHAPDVLARREGRKAACTAAKQLRTEDVTETKKCFAYATNAIAACNVEKVPLP